MVRMMTKRIARQQGGERSDEDGHAVTDKVAALIDAVVDRHRGTRVTSAVPIQSGVNRVFRLRAGDQRLIVRLSDVAEIARFRKEAWCIDRAAAAGVPSPAVLAVGAQGAYAYMLENDVPGRRGTELGPAGQLSTWRHLGALLRRIHDIALAGFGEELAGMTTGGDARWQRYLAYNLGELTARDPLMAMGVLTKEDQDRLRSDFEGLARAPLRFGLSHGDFSLRNAIVGDDGLVSVIDWGEAHAHVVPHFDLGVVLQTSLRDDAPGFAALLDGYGLDRAGYDVIRSDIQALRLLIATDKVRWARDRRPDRLAGTRRILQALLATSMEGATS